MPNQNDGRSTLLEASDHADLLTRFERNIRDSLDRIERDLKERSARMERDLENHQAATAAKDDRLSSIAAAKEEKLEVRLRLLEDTRTKGAGVWFVLGGALALVASCCCIFIANTALDEVRATRQQIWGSPQAVIRK